MCIVTYYWVVMLKHKLLGFFLERHHVTDYCSSLAWLAMTSCLGLLPKIPIAGKQPVLHLRGALHILTHMDTDTPMLRISQSIVSLGKSIVKMLCWFQSQKTTVCSFNSETQQSKMIWVNYIDFVLVFIFNQHFQRQTIKFNQNPIKWPNCANSKMEYIYIYI